MLKDSALLRAALRLCSLPTDIDLPEKTKKAFPWAVYCSPATAPKTSKTLTTRKFMPQ
jgi:hypothetical protein